MSILKQDLQVFNTHSKYISYCFKILYEVNTLYYNSMYIVYFVL